MKQRKEREIEGNRLTVYDERNRKRSRETKGKTSERETEENGLTVHDKKWNTKWRNEERKIFVTGKEILKSLYLLEKKK